MTAIQLGPLVLSSPRFAAIAGVAAFLIAAHVAARRAPRLADASWTAVAIVVAGARVGWVIENLSVYLERPLTALYLWQGGFSPLWGLAAAAVWMVRARLLRAAVPAAVVGLATWGGTHLLTAPAPGTSVRLPEVTLTTLDGEAAPLATRARRPLVVNLWAPWCPPCRRETPMMVGVAGSRDDVDFAFVDQATGAAEVRAFLDRHDLPAEDVRLDPGRRVASEVGAIGLPTTLFFGPAGELHHRHVGEISRAALGRRLDQVVRRAAGRE